MHGAILKSQLTSPIEGLNTPIRRRWNREINGSVVVIPYPRDKCDFQSYSIAQKNVQRRGQPSERDKMIQEISVTVEVMLSLSFSVLMYAVAVEER